MNTTDWPDPDEVRRWLDNVGTMYDWPRERSCMTVMVEAARAYLRMREQRPAEPTPHSDESIDCRESFDARDWARHFRATACRLGFSDMDEDWLHVWFANAIMRGWDEHAKQQPAEPALSIEQVIAACGGGKLWELTVYPLKKGVAARVKVGSGDYLYSPEDGCATPEAAIQALGKDAIAKLRERHAADAQKLKELGVEP